MNLFPIDLFRRQFFWPQIAGIVFFVCMFFYPIMKVFGSYVSSGSLTSVIFDTAVAGGVDPNYIMWQGAQPSGASVSFQIAVSNNSGGPWSYLGPSGTTGLSDLYTAGPGVPVKLIKAYTYGYRYLSYKMYLSTNNSVNTPVVTNVTLGWSF